jgi:hypothetical protein
LGIASVRGQVFFLGLLVLGCLHVMNRSQVSILEFNSRRYSFLPPRIHQDRLRESGDFLGLHFSAISVIARRGSGVGSCISTSLRPDALVKDGNLVSH